MDWKTMRDDWWALSMAVLWFVILWASLWGSIELVLFLIDKIGG